MLLMPSGQTSCGGRRWQSSAAWGSASQPAAAGSSSTQEDAGKTHPRQHVHIDGAKSTPCQRTGHICTPAVPRLPLTNFDPNTCQLHGSMLGGFLPVSVSTPRQHTRSLKTPLHPHLLLGQAAADSPGLLGPQVQGQVGLTAAGVQQQQQQQQQNQACVSTGNTAAS